MRPDQDSSVKAVRPIAAIAQVSTSGTYIRMASNIRKISKCNTSCTRVINSCTHLNICILQCVFYKVHSTMRFLQCVFYNVHSTMRLHPDVHMSSSEACRTADPRQIRRAALFLSVHVSPVSFSALFLLLHICTVSSIALFLSVHVFPVSFIALFFYCIFAMISSFQFCTVIILIFCTV